MSLNDYKLSTELAGHTLDVRCVFSANNCILSGSRDKTVKIWEREGNNTFKEINALKDHTNFVSSICVINNGTWICTGSNDSTICVYIFGESKPFTVLKQHKGTVSSLAQGINSKILVSGSWDQTARIWNDLDSSSTSIELKGHEAAVWAVCALKSERYATGSADKNIFIWNTRGEKLVVLKGHTDCVRGLVSLPDGSLLSCANDASIRHWSNTWECLKELHGHANYIYTIALNPALGPDVFVTGSEDNTIRMWSASKGALGDSIALPAQSVWSVFCDESGDIITGSSDALVRVFTKDAEKVADASLVTAFNVAVETRKAEQSKDLGGIKVNDLPGPESLLQEGTEGQTRLVRHPDGKILCYQWSKGNWECVGDVMGASGGTDKTSGKTLFEGKEYDFVFSVDIKDNEPPIKLPYNNGEDPWHVAQQFIYKNDLPQVYLEQIANFIITNANISTLPPTQSDPDFADPFTGGGRYIPTGGDTAPPQNGAAPTVNFRSRTGDTGAVNLDPFTGGSSYSTGKTDSNIVQRHLPHMQYMTFDVYDAQKVLDKIKEFNGKVEDASLKFSDDLLQGVVSLAGKQNLSAGDSVFVDALKKMLNWPQEIRFPVLDIVRLAVRNQETCTALGGAEFLDSITANLSSLAPNQLMSTRTLANMMNHGWGRGLIELKINEVSNIISQISKGTVNLQIAVATFFLNATISQHTLPSDEICTTLVINLIKLFSWISDEEAAFRACLALGNLVKFNGPNVTPIIKSVDELLEKLKGSKMSGSGKLSEIATELSDLL